MAGAQDHRAKLRQRRAEIAEAVRTRPNATYEAIGQEFGGISRERVRQIAVQFKVDRRRKQPISQPPEGGQQ